MKRTIIISAICAVLAAFSSCSAPVTGNAGSRSCTPSGEYADADTVQGPVQDTVVKTFSELRRPDVRIHIKRGHSLALQTDGLLLTAADAAVQREADYSVTSLYSDELPPLPQGMVNMTASTAGYRLLPGGEHFSPAAELRISYDPEMLPEGYTPDDIYTSFFDSATLSWVRLERIAVDTVKREIVSLTTHFTDFVNELLKAPEMPETQAFVPTAMSDLEAANPMAGLTLMQPPSANGEGTANLSYPIDIPAGRGGMQPSLALTYNSGGGNGWLGVGWDISVPSITIDTRWGVPRYSASKETEIYLYGGEQLVNKNANGIPYPLPHRTDQQQDRMTGLVRFYARTGDAHDSIIRHGDATNEYWWEVVDRTGVTHYYGHYSSNGLNNTDYPYLAGENGNIARWMLCESRDLYGNWVRYFYKTVTTAGTNPGRQIYLDSISYTGHENENGIYNIVFHRKDRSLNDNPVSCNYGYKEETDKVLCYIEVKSRDTVITGYYFETECRDTTNFKTRLKAVYKLDCLNNDGSSANLKSICTNGIPVDVIGVTRTEFGYYNAPRPDTIFKVEQTFNVRNDSVKGFMMNPRHRIDTVHQATALGLSHSSSWSIGGTLAAGLGPEIWKTNNSIGGSYSRSKSTSESLMSLVDLDGDGLSDKVFVKNGKMYWSKQEPSVTDNISFGDTQSVGGASHFLLEGSFSNTFGAQASVSVASGSGGWTNSTSITSTYFSDVNGDGLIDIVDNDTVRFNRLVDGQPTFSAYQSQPSSGELPPIDPPYQTTSECGGIIFDGEVNDSVACRKVWKICEVGVYFDNYEDALLWCQENPQNDDRMVEPVPYEGGYHIVHYCLRLDSTRRDLAMNGVPQTEAVRVWVVPEDGTATVQSYIRLIEDESYNRLQSRHADGITYTIQHSRGVTPMGDTLHSTKDTILMSRYICGDCYRYDNFDEIHYDSTYTFSVSEGDVIFFRLRSNNDKQFDNVEDHIKISLNGFLCLSNEGFLLTENKFFQAPYNGGYHISGEYENNCGNINLEIKQPDGASPDGVTPFLGWYGDINKDSIIRIILKTTDNDTRWENVTLRAKIQYWSDSLPDTITFWTPGERRVIHPSNSVWGNAKYQRLFGSLYDGWGQFAYHPVGNMSNSLVIRPGSLKPPIHNITGNVSDTNGMRDHINTPIPEEGFNQPTQGDFTEEYGTQYSIINDSSCWVEMTADAEHYRWVAYGAQNSIGCDTMSNSLQSGWYSSVAQVSEDSSAFLPPEVEYDDAIPVQTGETPVKCVRKVNRSFNQSYSLGIASYGGSYSHGSGNMDMDYIDLNGDRYPDIVGPSYVQYRSQWGGLGSLVDLPNGIENVSASITNSIGSSFGASPVSHKRTISSRPANAKYTLEGDGNGSVDLSFGWNHTSNSWIDMNGDGLPDYVTEDGDVRLNTGYGFLSTEDWNFEGIQSGQSATNSMSIGASGALEALKKLNKYQGSIQLGAGLSRSANRTTCSFIDINGDGLPDMIWRRILDLDIIDWGALSVEPTGTVHVKLNLGGGRWSDTYNLDIKNFNWSESYNESLTAGLTLGVTILGVFKLTCGVNGSPYGSSVNRDRMQLVDVNGDGMPDLVTSDKERQMKVCYNKGGKTNLLKKVTNSTGSRIYLDYTLSQPSYEQPSRSWQLTLVTTKDPLNPNGGDTTVTRFIYQNPRYDRLERSSYGYGTVITEQINPSDNSVYRTVRRDFHNENILVKGKPKRELTTDGQGNKYIEKEYQYNYAAYVGNVVDTCSGNAYSLRDRIVTRFFEGTANPKLTTAEAYEYDRYHNITKYIDEGDTAYNDDGLYVEMDYLGSQPNNLVALRSAYRVYATGTMGTNWMRYTTFLYDNLTGKLTRQTFHNTTNTSEYDFTYDSYGNLKKAEQPLNDSNQRMTYLYTYDNYLHSYPVKIKNSYNDSVLTTYNLLFGKPTRVTDPSGNNMLYGYDFAGRLVSVTSPLNTSGRPSLVIEYYPVNYYQGNYASSFSYPMSMHPYAVTIHNDDDGYEITETSVITDGFGRVIQTKKGITANGQQKWQVSGRTFTDPFGRMVRQYDPFTEPLTNYPGVFNSYYASASETASTYDVMDRVTQTSQPLNVVTNSLYGVNEDNNGRRRFTTTITDPNSIVTCQFSDYEGRQVQVTDAEGGITVLHYDNLGQIVEAIDPENFSTIYYYDKLGRLIQRDHPDAGTTQYTYDPTGNVTSETNPLGQIFYDYSYKRLAKKRYSGIVGNNVKYTYGTTGNGKSRPVRIKDGTGERELEYDALGNITEERRIVAIPGSSNVYMFESMYQYDSWGRMHYMTYPDGERIVYGYTFGGDLIYMSGLKGSEYHDYIIDITYNDYGQRSRVEYGNGTYATYSYDALHRLSNLTSVSASGTMQRLRYTIDGVGNIGVVSNSVSAIAALGGLYTNEYTYDGLYRLTQSDELSGRYGLTMSYSPSGRLENKIVSSLGTFPTNKALYYGYCDEDKPHAPRRVLEENSLTLSDLLWDAAGNLGQINIVKSGNYDESRFLFWTEDSRLNTVADHNYYSYYAYDYSGERTLKLTGQSTVLDVNANSLNVTSILENVTLYPTPYIVLSNRGYTKHYYIGSDRLCARKGGGGIEPSSPNTSLSDIAQDVFDDCSSNNQNRTLSANDIDCLHGFGLSDHDDQLQQPIDEAPQRLKSTTTIKTGDFDDMIDYFSANTEREDDVYFYHGDHLGGANWITDAKGIPIQHLQYLPFGECYIDQHATGSTYDERFTFTGKEKDSESGFYYFGARYYDCDLSGLFLSVDPMSDKYPSISPYAYCAWNPVKLIDPDGEDWYEYTDNTTGEKKIAWTECHTQKQLDKVHKNAKHLGLTVDDGKTYYGLMGDEVDKSDEERYNMVRDLDLAIIKRAQQDVNGGGVFDDNQFVDFSNVFTDNNKATKNQMVRWYEYGGGEATIAMNQKNMRGRFNPELHTSVSGDDNLGMGGPGAGVMAVKCPRYEIRQGSGRHSIAGISFYKKPAALARFQRMYKHISSGAVLSYSTKEGNNWNRSFF